MLVQLYVWEYVAYVSLQAKKEPFLSLVWLALWCESVEWNRELEGKWLS